MKIVILQLWFLLLVKSFAANISKESLPAVKFSFSNPSAHENSTDPILLVSPSLPNVIKLYLISLSQSGEKYTPPVN